MKRTIKQLITGIQERDVRTHASSIAFFFFMALIPLLILLASIVPFYGLEIEHVISFFREILPDDAAKMIGEIIREAFDHSGLAFSVSLVMLLWTASRGVYALTEGLNAMYDEEDTRKFAKSTLLSFGYTFALMLFMCTAIYFIFSGKVWAVLKRFIPGIRLQSGSTTFLEFVVLLLVGILFFCYVYKFLPSGKRSLTRQFPGAFIASTGWVIFSMGFRVYVGLFNSFTRFYGSLATVILLLFWFYWIFYILLAGGFVNAHLDELVPARFLDFYHDKKSLSLIVTGLFLVGFLSYMSDCFLNSRLYVFSWVRILLALFRMVTMGFWLAATIISVREMGMSFPRKYMVLLALLAVGDFFLMRRALIPNLLMYLVIFTFWNLAILLLCMQVMFREEWKAGSS